MTDWPREIWMAEREEHDQGVVTAVLSEFATVARFPGDKDREREFHHYVDADIHESAERYYKHQLEQRDARIAEFERARAAWNTRADATVAKAVAAERERCVAIVEAFIRANKFIPDETNISKARSLAIQLVCVSIADAIRGDSQ